MRQPFVYIVALAAACLVLLAISPFPSGSGALVAASASSSDAFTNDVSAALGTALTPEQAARMDQTRESHTFQTEVSRLMKLIINSLYKTRDIFLRELISNASDALDRIRFLALTDAKAYEEGGSTLNITIRADLDAKTLTIRDSGIGMTKKQLRDNLGTIAKSGTSDFLKAVENATSSASSATELASQIGQFGVGFYSAFLVADSVVVASKHNDDPVQHIWESTAVSEFTIAEDPRGNTLGRGTEIVLKIKEDAVGYLDETRLRQLITKYSEFINFPIYLHTETLDMTASDSSKEKKEDGTDDAEPKITTKWELMNTHKPLWRREPRNVTEQEYKDFYKATSKDAADPIAWTHFKAEGDVDFNALVYAPSKQPPAFYKEMSDALIKSVKLFVRRVFITDEMPEFLPRWMSFIKAVVDADDLPLNVSRETLQKHRALKIIRKRLIRKTLDMLEKMALNDPDRYMQFYYVWATNIKMGVLEDKQYADRLTRLLRFYTSHLPNPEADAKTGTTLLTSQVAAPFNMTSLDDYISRMREGQKNIFFVGGSTLEELRTSPFIETLLARGYEVLFMDEPMDEYLTTATPSYRGYTLQNAAKEGLVFGDESDADTKEQAALAGQFKALAEKANELLGSKRVSNVTVSSRLTSSPAALVASQLGWSGNMHRVMQSQAFQSKEDQMLKFFLDQKPMLELNPKHPVVIALNERLAKLEDATDRTKELETIETAIWLLYDTSALRSGYGVDDAAVFASRIDRVLRENIGVDVAAKADVKVSPAPAVKAAEKDKTETTELLPDSEDVFKVSLNEEAEDDEQAALRRVPKSKEKLLQELKDTVARQKARAEKEKPELFAADASDAAEAEAHDILDELEDIANSPHDEL
ncbi:heat shock protein Hsp90 [Ramicandelaber brevisporus]|nr:heat shock protein Hsp90 [Ramicandelaber brevisporus]